MADASSSQTIIAARHEIDKTAIAQILQLLAYLRPDVLVSGIEFAKVPFEAIYLIQRELVLAERFYTLHHIKQPSAGLRRFTSEEERLLPFGEHQLLCADDPFCTT